jgi:multidrug efflux pump subunit AcrA (membrane-fusion protein)
MFLLEFTSCTSNSSTHPTRQDIEDVVYCVGEVTSSEKYFVTSYFDGYIDDLYFTEGDSIEKDQLILTLDKENQWIKVDQSIEGLAMARENSSIHSSILSEYRLELQSLLIRRKNDSIHLSRIQRLYKLKSASYVELEKAEYSYNISLNEYQKKYLQLDKIKSELKRNVSQEHAKVNLNNADLYLRDFRSKINGQIIKLYKNRGDFINKGEPIAFIANTNKLVLSLNVNEEDIRLISPRQDVVFLLKTDQERKFAGIVNKISKFYDVHNNSFKVEVLLVDTMATHLLYMNTPVEAHIIVKRRKNILVIPKSYLLEGNQVITKDGFWSKRTPVKIGQLNGDWVEIIDGISENNTIIKGS